MRKGIVFLGLLCLCAVGHATVTGTASTAYFTCTSSTGPFPFTFPVDDIGGLVVIDIPAGSLPGVMNILATYQWTATPVNNSYSNGGSVTLFSSCPSGDTLVIARATEPTQLTHFTQYMPALYANFENGLDDLTTGRQDSFRVNQVFPGIVSGAGTVTVTHTPLGQFLNIAFAGSGGGGGGPFVSLVDPLNQSMAGPLTSPGLTTPILNNLPADEYQTTSGNPSQLTYWWRYLHNTPTFSPSSFSPSGGLDLIIPNDSLFICDVTSCPPNTGPEYGSSRQAEQLRVSLQSQFGYGGTGLMPLIDVAQNLAVNAELYTNSGSIATNCLIGPQYAPNAWCSVVQMGTGQVITLITTLPYAEIKTYCADNPSSNAITVAIDGTNEGTACGTPNSVPVARVATTSTVNLTSHTTTFTCTTAPCFMYGAEGRTSYQGSNYGVRVHNLSVGSAPSGWFAGHTQFEDLISDGYGTTGSAQLVIYAMGTNDAGLSVPLSTYEANFESYISHELAKTTCPGSTAATCQPIIVIYRPGIDEIASQPYFSALTGYGYTNNMLVIDQTNEWGTTYIPSNWYLAADNIHYNDAGALDAGQTLLRALEKFPRSASIAPLAGDFGLNSGVYSVTSPSANVVSTIPGFQWFGVPGIPSNKGFFGWPTGSFSGENIGGSIGLFDPNYAGIVYGTDAGNDFCVHTPTTGGDFGTCAGADLEVDMSTHVTIIKGGSVVQYRCVTAGAARAGTYTSVAADCGSSVATGVLTP